MLRRVLIVTANPGKKEREEALKKSFQKTNTTTNWKQWINSLKQIRSSSFNWTFSEKVKNELII